MKNVFIIGAKNIGQYGGFETFVDKLTEVHQNDGDIQYYIVTKANGKGAMDESRLDNISVINNKDGEEPMFLYHNAVVVKLHVWQIGSAQAVLYDKKAMEWCLEYIARNHINSAIIYVLACRLGPFFPGLVKKAHKLGCRVFVNPDGLECKRKKWNIFIRSYWKFSERLMVRHADRFICDSKNIQKIIEAKYKKYSPLATYISYGADISLEADRDAEKRYSEWLDKHGLKKNGYYMCCGRLVPENSFDIMIKEFMLSKSVHDFAVITTKNDRYLESLEKKLHWKSDTRIKFINAEYDSSLLKIIRENACGNIHGHTMGGTNPTLLEALASTDLNLVINVPFNREVAGTCALYWNRESGNLARFIDMADKMDSVEKTELGKKAKDRIRTSYNWKFIGDEYKKLFFDTI